MDDKNNGQWKLAYWEIIKKYGGKLIFECELTKELISEMFGKNNFLKDIIISAFKQKQRTSRFNGILISPSCDAHFTFKPLK